MTNEVIKKDLAAPPRLGRLQDTWTVQHSPLRNDPALPVLAQRNLVIIFVLYYAAYVPPIFSFCYAAPFCFYRKGYHCCYHSVLFS